MCDRARVITV